MVISDALPVSAAVQFEKWLAAVRDLRPALKPFVPLVVAMMARAEGTALATAAGDAAIVVWCGRRIGTPGSIPRSVHTLEHEAAQVFSIRTGIPDEEDWEAAMREDSTDPDAAIAACLLLAEIADTYDPVIGFGRIGRTPLSGVAATFADRFPARSRRISHVFRG